MTLTSEFFIQVTVMFSVAFGLHRDTDSSRRDSSNTIEMICRPLNSHDFTFSYYASLTTISRFRTTAHNINLPYLTTKAPNPGELGTFELPWFRC